MSKITKRSAYFALVLSIATLNMLVYQNCGEMRPSSQAVFEQSSYENRYLRDKITLDRLLPSPSLRVWISAKESLIEPVTGDPTSIASLNNGGLTMAPAAVGAGPSLTTASAFGGSVLSFGDGKSLVTTGSVQAEATSYSVVVLLEGPLMGRVATINAGVAGSDERTISIESGVIKARRQRIADNFEELTSTFDATKTGPIVIAASFGEQPGKIFLQVNGRVVRASAIATGDPQVTSLVSRSFALGGPATSLKVAEALVIGEALTQAELNTMSRFLAERWGTNSVYFDPSLFPIGSPGSTDDLPSGIRALINTKCASCHSQWYTYRIADFKSSGLVRAGEPVQSPLYFRMKFSEGAGTKDMPQTGDFSQAEADSMKQWIQGLK